MTTQSPLLGTNLWDSGITQPDLVFNDAIRQYDALIAGLILSRTTDAEPGSPAEGDAYIMTGSASGTDWATFDEDDIAVFSGDVWKQYPPAGRIQMMVGDETNEFIFWDGAAWSTVPAPGLPLTTKGDIFGFSTVDARIPVGTNDHVLTADSSEALGVKWAAGGGGGGSTVSRTTLTPIETIDNTGGAGDFDFNSIAAGYDRLIIKGTLRGDVTAEAELVNIYLNDDTTDGNYHSQRNSVSNGVGVFTEGANPAGLIVTGASSPANQFATVKIEIESPNDANNKVVLSTYTMRENAGGMRVGTIGVTSSVTAALTRIRIQSDNDPTDELFGTLTLYGEKDEDILVPV
jgi:hypothetical protein